jgi:hypothetical protein
MPQWLRNVQTILSVAMFCLHLMFRLSKVHHPLPEPTRRKMIDLCGTPQIEQIFLNLKECFSTAPILTNVKSTCQCIIQTDTFDLELGAVLS